MNRQYEIYIERNITTQEVIDVIFNDPSVKYELTEFQRLGKTIPEMLNLYSRPGIGKQTGKDVYYIKPLCKFHSGKEEFQIYVEVGKSSPEEIVRQLWVWKLINYYGYSSDQISGEKIGERYGDSVVEAHHIDYFTHSQNNDSTNIIIISPNYHRIIHKNNPRFNRHKFQFEFTNGEVLRLKLYEHLKV